MLGLPLISPASVDELLTLRAGQATIVVGFISDEQPGKIRPEPPKKAWHDAEVRQRLSKYTVVLDRAGGLSCSGASGGPVFVQLADGRFALLGLVSAASGAPCDGQVNVTLIPQHLSWIETVGAPDGRR